MKGSEHSRFPLGWRVAAGVCTIAGIALVASVIAYWGWRWLGPTSPPVVGATPADPATAILAANLFGGAATPPAVAVPVAEALAGETRLLGVFAEADGKGRALFRLPSGVSRLVAAGTSIDEQTTLIAVRPDGVTIRDATGERALVLRTATAKPARRSAGGVEAAAGRNPACAVPTGFKGPVVKLNAELVQGLIAQPESWRPIVEPRDGALVVREEAGFAAMIGLARGDRVEQANGIALRSTEDVIAAVLRPLAGSQSVRLLGSRAGERRELLLQNAGSCPG